jgi:hypothetical protein
MLLDVATCPIMNDCADLKLQTRSHFYEAANWLSSQCARLRLRVAHRNDRDAERRT